MSEKEEKTRLALLISDSLAKRIDDYRFEKRHKTLTSAIVELLELGLRQAESEDTKDMQK